MKMLGAAAVICLAVGAHAGDAVDGKAVYQAKCATCHGKDGKGNASMAKMFKVEPAALDLTKTETSAKNDEELAGVTSKGKGKMPAFAAKLKEGEIAAAVAYLRGLGGAPKPEAEAAKAEPAKSAAPDLAAAAKTFAAKCASCHGKDAKGNPAMAKMFKVEPSAMDLTGGKASGELAGVISKGKGKMPAFDGKLKAEEIAGLAAYLASLAAH